MAFPRAAIVCSFAIVSCTHPQRDAEKILAQVGAPRLRRDAAMVYKDLFAATAPEVVVLRPAQWPASFHRFSPSQVVAYPDGFALAVQKSGDIESGIYVVPAAMDHRPSTTSRLSYAPLADGVFWYSFSR